MSNVKELAAKLLAEQLEEQAANQEHSNQEPIYWTVYKAHIHFGETCEAIRKHLRDEGFEVGVGWQYTTQEIYNALSGNFQKQRTRVEKEKADKLVREKELDNGTLVEWERVVSKLNQKLKLPTINALDNAPNDEAREWVEKTLKPIWMQALEDMKKEIVEDYKRDQNKS